MTIMQGVLTALEVLDIKREEAAADEVTASNDGDGVAKWLEANAGI